MRALLLPLFCLLSTLTAGTEEVLFIGNSYTFQHQLPHIIESLSNGQLKADSYAQPAISLASLLQREEHPQLYAKIRGSAWAWVVLQDQSQAPSVTPASSLKSMDEWCNLVRERGASPVLFLTWAHLLDGKYNHEMQDATTATYCRAAVTNGARIAPVGEAWRAWYLKYPKKPLHAEDGSHPNATGAYLTACVIYCTLTGQSAVGLPVPRRIVRSGKQIQRIATEVSRDFSAQKFLKTMEAAPSQ